MSKYGKRYRGGSIDRLRNMVDTFSPERRREIMQSVRQVRTKPEETLAFLLKDEGFGYAMNVEDLPGKPDFVFEDAGLIVFVHGCFWHGHDHCRKGRSRPKSNRRYWREKIDRNKRRDQRIKRQLRQMGYSVYVVWECELRNGKLPARVTSRLDSRTAR